MASGGILCLEGQWHRDLADRSSVLPTLDLLQRRGKVRFIHKDVATLEELQYYLDRWLLRQYAEYQVCFFAMHGEPTRLWLTDRQPVEIDALAEHLSGKCTGKRLFFGSCSFMRASDKAIQAFLAETGASLACGYTRDVDWVEAAAFETVLLDVLANSVRANGAEVRMSTAHWAPLANYLGFRVVYANGRVWRPDGPVRIPAQA